MYRTLHRLHVRSACRLGSRSTNSSGLIRSFPQTFLCANVTLALILSFSVIFGWLPSEKNSPCMSSGTGSWWGKSCGSRIALESCTCIFHPMHRCVSLSPCLIACATRRTCSTQVALIAVLKLKLSLLRLPLRPSPCRTFVAFTATNSLPKEDVRHFATTCFSLNRERNFKNCKI